MRKLSKEAEARVIAALEDVVQRIDTDDDPNAYLAKAAGDYGIPAGHIPVMVRAYNTGRTNSQRLSSDSVLEKAAEFPLADADTVREILFPSQVKTAAQQTHEQDVDAEYASPPHFARRRAVAEKRAAAVDYELPPLVDRKPEPLPREDNRIKQALDRRRYHRRRLEAGRADIQHAADQLGGQLDKLANYFRRAESMPFQTVKQAVEARYGQQGAAIMQEVARRRPHVEKQAARESLVRVDPDAEPFSTVQSIVKLGRDLAHYKRAYARLEQQVDEAAEASLRPFVPSRPGSVLRPSEKQGGVFSGIAGLDFVARQLGKARKSILDDQPSKTDAIRKIVKQLDDPEHEASLRAIRARGILEDLMTNDPHISSYDPQQVAEAYNAITEVNPRIADQRLMLQGLLRRQLEQEGVLDPHDVTQNVLNPEKALRERDTGAKDVEPPRPAGQPRCDENGKWMDGPEDCD